MIRGQYRLRRRQKESIHLDTAGAAAEQDDHRDQPALEAALLMFHHL